jgi:hypothetical protein
MYKSVITALTLAPLIFFYNSIAAQEKYSLLEEASINNKVLSSGALKDYNGFLLNSEELDRLYTDASNSLQLTIPNLDGSAFHILVHKKNIFSDGFSVNTEKGTENNLDFGIHYAGKLENDSNSLVAFSFYKNCMFGLIATDEGNFNVVFLRDENNNPSFNYVLYNDRDLTIANNFHCNSQDLPEVSENITNIPKSQDEVCRTISQYLECDFSMYKDNGYSVQNTVSWATGMFNVMAGIYSAEQIDIKISEIYVWTSNDNYPFTSANEALKAFGNLRQDHFNGDIGHLLSTRKENNGGMGWVNVLCKKYVAQLSYGRFAYSNIDDSYSSLPLWSWTINAITHETGHNLGSRHTHWCGWELSPGNFGPIDHCFASESNNGVQCYTGPIQPITGTIMSYCHVSGNVNLNAGFGTLPGNFIRNTIAKATCLGPSVSSISGAVKYCVGDRINLAALYSGGQVLWTGPKDFSSSSNSISIFNATKDRSGIYTIKVTGASCVAVKNIQIDISEKPVRPVIEEIQSSILTCQPIYPELDYDWYNKAGIKLASGPSFIPPVSGDYYVVALNNGCPSEPSALFNTLNLMSIDAENPEFKTNAWPNPASEHISVGYNSNTQNTTATVYDMNGRIMLRHIETGNPIQINTGQLSDGMYLLELNVGGQKSHSKFLIKK